MGVQVAVALIRVSRIANLAATASDQVPAPALVVAGGGGASLDKSPPDHMWHPIAGKNTSLVQAAITSVILTFKTPGIDVSVYAPDDANKTIDHFSINYVR